MEHGLQSLLTQILADVDGALACLVCNLVSSDILAVAHDIEYFSEPYLEAVVAASVDMFRGKKVVAIENLLSSLSGTAIEHGVTELQITTMKTYHFMVTLPEKPDLLMVLVINRTVSLGRGWATLRKHLPEVSALCS